MQKSDLRPGMLIRYRDGRRRLVLSVDGDLMLFGNTGHNDLKSTQEDLTHIKFSDLDIVEVRKPSKSCTMGSLFLDSSCSRLIWQRPLFTKKMTMQEVCEMAGCNVEIIKEEE